MFSDSDIYTANVVAQCGSIRAAAKKLHKSQPAVSHGVMRLEEKLGFPLFDRSGYRISLTAEGHDFLQRSEGLLSIDAHLQDYAEVIRKGQESTLSIAVWPMLDQVKLMAVLAQLNENYPQTSLRINYVESLGGQNMLLNEEVAIAVHPGRIFLGEQLMESRVINQMTLINVIAPSLLNQKPDNRGISEQLLHWNRVVMKDSASEVSYGVGIHEGGKHWVVNDQRILAGLVYQGLAWGMLPEPVVRDSLAAGDLVKLDVPEFGSDLTVDILVSRLKKQPLGPVASACWQAFATAT
jgi:DNA-binding transcriptional LysR family regulator